MVGVKRPWPPLFQVCAILSLTFHHEPASSLCFFGGPFPGIYPSLYGAALEWAWKPTHAQEEFSQGVSPSLGVTVTSSQHSLTHSLFFRS